MDNQTPLDTILHYGVKRKSGRYAWGSGEDPQQGESSHAFMAQVDGLRGKGLKDTEIAQKMGINTTQLRNNITWAKKERTEFIQKNVAVLEKTGMTNTAIAQKLGISEGSVRDYRNKDNAAEKHQKMQ